MLRERPDITYHQLLREFCIWARGRGIDQSGCLDRDLHKFYVESAVKRRYNLPVKVEKDFNKIIDNNTFFVQEKNGTDLPLIDKAITNEIDEILRNSFSMKILTSFAEFIIEHKRIEVAKGCIIIDENFDTFLDNYEKEAFLKYYLNKHNKRPEVQEGKLQEVKREECKNQLKLILQEKAHAEYIKISIGKEGKGLGIALRDFNEVFKNKLEATAAEYQPALEKTKVEAPNIDQEKCLRVVANNFGITIRRFAQIQKISKTRAKKALLWLTQKKKLIESEEIDESGTLGYSITEKGEIWLEELDKKRAGKPETKKEIYLRTIANNTDITKSEFARIQNLSKQSAKKTLSRLKKEKLIDSEVIDNIGTLRHWITEKGERWLHQLDQERPVKPSEREAVQPQKKVAIEQPKSRGGRPRKKIDVRKVVELKQKGLSNRNIANKVGATHPTITKILNEQQKPS